MGEELQQPEKDPEIQDDTAARLSETPDQRDRFSFVWWLQIVLMLVVSYALAQSPVGQYAQRYLAAHHALFLAITITLLVCGVVLLAVTLVWTGLQQTSRQPLPPNSPVDRAWRDRPVIASASVYRFKGKSFSASVEDSWKFAEMKAAWRSGAWRSDPVWRRRYLACVSFLIIAVGIPGVVIAGSGSAWGLMLFAIVALYVLVRLAWAFVKVKNEE
jgi:hypothetical protein